LNYVFIRLIRREVSVNRNAPQKHRL
jgi:hypothetical protein